MASTELELEFELRVCVVGPQGCGKSFFIKQLLQQASLQQTLELGNPDADDQHLALQQLPDNTNAGSSENNHDGAHPPKKGLLPSLDSVGVNFKSETFTIAKSITNPQTGKSKSVSSLLRVECYEVGGASCAGAFADKALLLSTAKKCDVVLALYDLCDKQSLKMLVEEIIPVLDCKETRDAIPIIVAGTKIDLRKKLTSEQKQGAVVGSEQRAAEEGLPAQAIHASSVGALVGVGLQKMRRQLAHDALQRRKQQLRSTPIFSRDEDAELRQTLWSLLAPEYLFLDQNAVPRKEVGSSSRHPGNDDDENNNDESKNGAGDGQPGEGDDDGDVPVIGAKKEGDEEVKGVSCNLCGCACQ